MEIREIQGPTATSPLDLGELKQKLKSVEAHLSEGPWVLLHTFERNGRKLELALTDRLRRAAKKAGLWNSKEMLTTLKNGSYGFETGRSRSASGRDGIFLLDRDYRPENEMMRKLFGRFLDKQEGEALARELKVPLEDLLPVRLVSHHLRLLGVLVRKAESDLLVLLDCDQG